MKQRSLHLVILGSLFLFTGICRAQTFTSLAINANTGPTVPTNLVEFNGAIYFQGTDATHGAELWTSNGTVGGTKLVSDIWPGNGSSSAANFTVFNGKLYFQANDSVHGNELWVTDGTAGGTMLLKDIYAGPAGSGPVNFAAFNNKLYFSATDSLHGNELWVTDGTEAGTVLVDDINPGTGSSNSYGPFTVYNNQLYFAATDGTHGYELWSTDGTTTAMVDDINAGSGSSNPQGFLVYNNELVFSATGADGNELWSTTGTAVGTGQIADINPGVSNADPRYLTLYNGKIYFQADNGQDDALWTSDGTSSGTTLVSNIGLGAEYFVVFNNKLFFAAQSSVNNSYQLFSSDGTGAGTTMITDSFISQGFNPNLLTVLGNTLYFAGQDSLLGYELYSSDGTGAGTVMHVPPAGTDFSPLLNTGQILAFNNALYFGATYNFISLGLWKYAPVGTGIQPVTSFSNLAVYPNPFSQNFILGGLQQSETYTITINDLTGRTIDRRSFTAIETTCPVQLADVPAGMYLVQVQNGTQSQTLKLVKE